MLRILLLLAVLLLISPQAANHYEARNKADKTAQQKIMLGASGDQWGCRLDEEDYPNAKFAIPPLVVSPDRLLVTACDTLYMLNSAEDVLWKWSTGGPGITAQPFVDSTSTVHVTAFDLIWVGLDDATGVRKWAKTANGRSVYSQMKPFRGDQYLVVTSMEGYRGSLSDSTIRDRIALCEGEEVLARADFPSCADLELWGEKILAVTHKPDGAEIEEIRLK